MQIAIEEHFLRRELDDYFHALMKGISIGSFDKVLPTDRGLVAADELTADELDPATTEAVEPKQRKRAEHHAELLMGLRRRPTTRISSNRKAGATDGIFSRLKRRAPALSFYKL